MPSNVFSFQGAKFQMDCIDGIRAELPLYVSGSTKYRHGCKPAQARVRTDIFFKRTELAAIQIAQLCLAHPGLAGKRHVERRATHGRLAICSAVPTHVRLYSAMCPTVPTHVRLYSAKCPTVRTSVAVGLLCALQYALLPRSKPTQFVTRTHAV